ncbi:hypothetical protein FSP39_001819 [Pinctada imbricata]|uniref:Transmembrane protein 144 n=1 Tax=Pinctada imbricata TaxID=66713 RepID=A0AA89C4P6_PINIB|nr:hypothetical protein FSP39_001819 [Pinctada imbricata]
MEDLLQDITTPVNYGNGTFGTSAPEPDGDLPGYVGYLTAGLAVLFFGSNFAPVKKFETGDGMFFQWIMCSATLLVGVVVNMIRKCPPFYPIVMLGGLLWETGNICVVPIIKTIGMGLGLCIWGMTNLLSGWATGRFGLFGLKPEVPGNTTMNYLGVAIAVSSSFIFALVKSDITPIDSSDEKEPLLRPTRERPMNIESDSLYTSSSTHDILIFNQKNSGSINRDEDDPNNTMIDRLSPGSKRAVGIVLSVISGVLYGQTFTPSTYLQDHGKSENALDYVFACFVGIYCTSTVYFIIYIIIMKNKPRVYPKAILPGVVSGIMWGMATTGWFVANKVLSEAVAFPIVTTGPSIIASLWGILVFKEIKGRRNISILMLGFVFVITGAVLTGFSKS